MKSSGKSKSLGSGTKPSCSQDSSVAPLHISSITFQNNSNKLGFRISKNQLKSVTSIARK